jgi:hypothetical protein
MPKLAHWNRLDTTHAVDFSGRELNKIDVSDGSRTTKLTLTLNAEIIRRLEQSFVREDNEKSRQILAKQTATLALRLPRRSVEPIRRAHHGGPGRGEAPRRQARRP